MQRRKTDRHGERRRRITSPPLSSSWLVRSDLMRNGPIASAETSRDFTALFKRGANMTISTEVNNNLPEFNTQKNIRYRLRSTRTGDDLTKLDKYLLTLNIISVFILYFSVLQESVLADIMWFLRFIKRSMASTCKPSRCLCCLHCLPFSV